MVLDTNIIISALLFGGNPRLILQLVITRRMQAITSPPLLAELLDVLSKKFSFSKRSLKLTERKIKQDFIIVYPSKQVEILKDNNPDNRVLETGLEGNCHYIITGDRELLELHTFKGIRIINAHQFFNMQN